MKPKKSDQANLEKKKGTFFFLGLVLSLSLILVAFEYKIFDDIETEQAVLEMDLMEEEVIPPSVPPPPPPPPPPQTATVIDIVDDEEEIEEEPEFDLEIDMDTEIDIIDEPEEEAEAEIFTIVEDMPEFPGGQEELFKYLGKSIKYPPMAKEAGIQGVVYVSFVVNEKGEIKDVEVLRGIGGGCDDEAIRVVKAMPNWTPGKQRGKPVKVQYNLPIRFRLS